MALIVTLVLLAGGRPSMLGRKAKRLAQTALVYCVAGGIVVGLVSVGVLARIRGAS